MPFPLSGSKFFKNNNFINENDNEHTKIKYKVFHKKGITKNPNASVISVMNQDQNAPVPKVDLSNFFKIMNTGN